MLQFRGLSVLPVAWSRKRRMSYNSQKTSLFCFHFPFGGKDKTEWESQDCPLCSLCSLAVSPTALEKEFSFGKSLPHFIWFIIFSSNDTVIYCIISHSAIIFSTPNFSFSSLPLFSSSRPISLPFPFHPPHSSRGCGSVGSFAPLWWKPCQIVIILELGSYMGKRRVDRRCWLLGDCCSLSYSLCLFECDLTQD